VLRSSTLTSSVCITSNSRIYTLNFFLEGDMNHGLSYLKNLLKTLSITSCLLLVSELIYLSQCPHINQLNDLELNGFNLTNVSLEPLYVFLQSLHHHLGPGV
jgi:hypothetical protein